MDDESPSLARSARVSSIIRCRISRRRPRGDLNKEEAKWSNWRWIEGMAGGKGVLEKVRRFVRTVYFMVAMVASLFILSLPLLVALGDILVPSVLISSFTCVGCYGFKEHLHRYAFKSSLTDIPLVSVFRSLVITCMTFNLLFNFINFSLNWYQLLICTLLVVFL